jgi:hypothetical protein
VDESQTRDVVSCRICGVFVVPVVACVAVGASAWLWDRVDSERQRERAGEIRKGTEARSRGREFGVVE